MAPDKRIEFSGSTASQFDIAWSERFAVPRQSSDGRVQRRTEIDGSDLIETQRPSGIEAVVSEEGWIFLPAFFGLDLQIFKKGSSARRRPAVDAEHRFNVHFGQARELVEAEQAKAMCDECVWILQ
jgi:hypothetical protein